MIHIKILYILIQFPLQIYRFAAYDIKKQAFDFWESKMSEWNEAAPTSVSNGFFASPGFAWMASERAFMTSAIQGILIALPCAFIILLLSTKNWIISIFAVITIIGIVSTEIMLMVLQNWKLGGVVFTH